METMFQGKTEWIKTIKRREKVIECYEIYRKIKTYLFIKIYGVILDS